MYLHDISIIQKVLLNRTFRNEACLLIMQHVLCPWNRICSCGAKTICTSNSSFSHLSTCPTNNQRISFKMFWPYKKICTCQDFSGAVSAFALHSSFQQLHNFCCMHASSNTFSFVVAAENWVNWPLLKIKSPFQSEFPSWCSSQAWKSQSRMT